jgi:diguanylate cyclase (GGDEF)-like protein
MELQSKSLQSGQHRKFIHFFRDRPYLIEAGVILVTAVIAVMVAAEFNWFERFYEFSRAHDDWELDEIFIVFVVFSVGGLIFAIRRLKETEREVKARRAAEQVAHALARHDPLTGLANRRYFAEQIDSLLLKASDQRLAVIMLDLDGFKGANDIHGHAAGDKVLVEVAERLTEAADPQTVLARIGGDEFAILKPNVVSLDDLTVFAHRVVTALSEPYLADETAVSVTTSVGIALAPDDGKDAQDLVRRSDLALYRAKAAGRSQIAFFEPEMDAHVERRARLERELKTAIADDCIKLHYQPLVALDGDQLVGFEALARWTSPTLGAIGPNVFIGIAEECGMISTLGDHLLRKACCEAVTWPSDITLAFNISPLQLRDGTLGLRILSILSETGLSPRRLELEITESALVGESGLAQSVVDQLRSAGVRIALDDFGTGYATMSQLLALRFDGIKIDRSFVQGLTKDSESGIVVDAIISLAKGLGITTTAEGIEDSDQLASLRDSGCDLGQGYLLGRAIPPEELKSILHDRHQKIAVA